MPSMCPSCSHTSSFGGEISLWISSLVLSPVHPYSSISKKLKMTKNNDLTAALPSNIV